jgi:hypothetical protein
MRQPSLRLHLDNVSESAIASYGESLAALVKLQRQRVLVLIGFIDRIAVRQVPYAQSTGRAAHRSDRAIVTTKRHERRAAKLWQIQPMDLLAANHVPDRDRIDAGHGKQMAVAAGNRVDTRAPGQRRSRDYLARRQCRRCGNDGLQ